MFWNKKKHLTEEEKDCVYYMLELSKLIKDAQDKGIVVRGIVDTRGMTIGFCKGKNICSTTFNYEKLDA